MKRLFDIVASSLTLVVLSPLLLIIIIVLKLTGEHEVWYMQTRVGQNGNHFNVFKFATMQKGSEFIGTKDLTLRDDPRVTPVGRILRKTKLNELPQILNILKGDMSVVGWRPLVPAGFDYYPHHVQEQIVRVKPGLTGIGSIMFRDEEAILTDAKGEPRQVQKEVIAPYKGELELWYQKHQSFWLDIKIIFVTAYVIIQPNSERYLSWFADLPARPEALA